MSSRLPSPVAIFTDASALRPQNDIGTVVCNYINFTVYSA